MRHHSQPLQHRCAHFAFRRGRGPVHIRLSRALDRELKSQVIKRTSRTKTPAPSPMTNPFRALSNGLEACWGVLLKVVAKLLDRSNPVIARGWMQDSAPPASITSTSPNAMNLEASPIEWAPVVQAVDTAWDGPLGVHQMFCRNNGAAFFVTLNPYLMDMWPAARLIRSLGTNRGDTFFGPWVEN